MPVDARHRLEDDPFDHRVTKSGQVIVRRGGRQVAVVAGAAADRLVARLARVDDRERQLLLARATGHYRHGNERGAS